MVSFARCDLILELDIDVANAQGESLISEARAAFVQGPRHAIKLYSEGDISICGSEKPNTPSRKIRVHLSPEDTGQFKSGPNAMVDFQLFLLPQKIVDGDAIPDSEPIASEVIAIPMQRSLAEAIIDLGGELIDP